MSELGVLLKDTVTRLFSQEVSREFLYTHENGDWAEQLWNLTEEMALCSILLPEEQGGADGDWDDVFEIVKTCGRYSVPLPIPENILARWLVSLSGKDLPEGTAAVVPSLEAPDRIPWGRNAGWLVGAGSGVKLVTLEEVPVVPDENLAREARDNLDLKGCEKTELDTGLPDDALFYLCAMLRSAQIAGAALALAERTVQYASEREQFGRPLSKLQAIQQNIARLATAAASIDAVSRSAFRRFQSVGFSDTVERDSRLAIAAAKYRASDCVELICRVAHQVHGAIGFTHEHDLHFFTRRMWSWRAEYGNAGYWARRLGELAVGRPSGEVWNMVTSCSDNSKQGE